jgi:hypothetical protein
MNRSICPRCNIVFSRLQRLKTHLNKNNPCHVINVNYDANTETKILCLKEKVVLEFICQPCGLKFTRKSNLKRHLQLSCPSKGIEDNLKPVEQVQKIAEESDDEDKFEDEEEEFEQSEKSGHSETEDSDSDQSDDEQFDTSASNDLNSSIRVPIVPPAGQSSYLDYLNYLFNNKRDVTSFVKECALAGMSGDYKLLRKIYFENNQNVTIKCLHKKKRKYTFYNENEEFVVDYGGQVLGKIFANCLQRCYLKVGSDPTISNQLNDYDQQSWNQHVYELSELKYQKKLMSNLDTSP